MKRAWKTQLKAQGKSPTAALAKLLKDPYALLITGSIYLRPEVEHSIESLIKPEQDRRILHWEASAEVTMLGKLEE